jgi:hypothetical protein
VRRGDDRGTHRELQPEERTLLHSRAYNSTYSSKQCPCKQEQRGPQTEKEAAAKGPACRCSRRSAAKARSSASSSAAWTTRASAHW